MKYAEIDKTNDRFFSISLMDVLLKIQYVAEDYKWSIQLIDAVGDIEGAIGLNVVELEKYCDESQKGFILNFEKLIDISKNTEDIIDILIIGCDTIEEMPKAYKTKNWEKLCKIIISREDSSLWQLFSQDPYIMNEFENILSQDQ